jgi:metal-responsive CopG/Arc/MetJ family transcriptional regulator
MKNYIATCVSFPRELLREVDEARGDVPRSVYIRRALQRELELVAPNVEVPQ